MNLWKVPRSCLGMAALLLAAAEPALAHGVVGKRFLPSTLAIDDPFVADELTLPMVTRFKQPAWDEQAAAWATTFSGEWSKRITRDLGLTLAGDLTRRDFDSSKDSVTGFGNLEVTLKYQLIVNEPHEFLLSAAFGWEVGGTGRRAIGAETVDSLRPAVLFGKGFGDLPESARWLRPLALTGVVGAELPLQGTTRKFTATIDEETGETEIDVDKETHPRVFRWGVAVMYSLPYLRAFVRDFGLPGFVNQLIPIVEVEMSHPLDRGHAGEMRGAVNPGVIWAGRFVQVGAEAIVPVNDRTGKHVGVRAILHFFLDDLFPNSIGRPIFGSR
ncbi:MAG: hypothetical protein HY294_08520 [Candidatus Rokubacteria bacterium]|nr:hypothetical protein [Candidatus Rokubacteria bacterium]MBI3826026.1 hypothetical protein [Candidatus Rokubacteria bacterium]